MPWRAASTGLPSLAGTISDGCGNKRCVVVPPPRTPSSPRAGGRSEPTGGWSAVGDEQRPWEPSPHSAIPHRHRLRYVGPYRAAVPAEIADADLSDIPHDVIALAAEASTEIARFDGEAGNDIAPFTSLLLRSESAASSKIENLNASARAIALAELGDPRQRNANVIVANTEAMQAAIGLADRIDERAILDMHDALLGDTHPEWVGRWRTEQVWIGGGDHGPHDALFVPPHHERVPAAMADLVAFMRRDDLAPLVQAAIAHAQFETIHPFPDGNGRTGRALVHALLRNKGLTRSVTVPVSAGLLVDKDAYFDALGDYRQGRPARIVELVADASFIAISNGTQLVADLQAVRAGWDVRIRARRDAAAWKIADLLLHQPIIDSPLAQRELGVAAKNVNAAIDHLVDADVLRKVSGQHRNRKWAPPRSWRRSTRSRPGAAGVADPRWSAGQR